MHCAYLQENWKHSSMPVICNNDTVLPRAEGQSSQRLYGSFVEQDKTLLVVRVV